jgi:putative ABC transport system permease protein
MSARPTSIGATLFRWLLRILPTDFRGDFGDAMLADVEAGDSQRALFWWREIGGLLRAVAREHLDAVRQDVHYALRMMRRTPGFTAMAVLMLAVGTGANVAMFSVIDAVMLRSRLADADRIVTVQEQLAGRPPTAAIPVSHVDAIAQAPTFAAVTATTGSLAVLRNIGEPHRLDIECVSASFFDVVQVRPALGRAFTSEDDSAGAPPVLVLSHQTWRRDFGSDPQIIGRSVLLGERPSTVIGVMPPGFIGERARNRTAGWAPFAPALAHQSAVGCNVRGTAVNLVARLQQPFTLETAAASLNASGLAGRLPAAGEQKIAEFHFVPADEVMYEDVRVPFLVLLGAVGCVLLIACANVANLQLERLVGRRRELALRRALGASRSRVIRQTLSENLLLSAMGAAGGVLAASLTLSGLTAMMPATVPHVADIRIDGRAMLVAVACALFVGLVVGLAPAWQASADGMEADLKSSGRGIAGGAPWLRRALVVTEVALSVVLLIGAGLLTRTFITLRPDQPGFATAGRIVARLSLPGDWKPDPSRRALTDQMMERLAAAPGVERVSLSSYLPLSGMTDVWKIRVGDTNADVWSSGVSPEYFDDMEIAVVRGRRFSASDGFGASPVAAINETAARRFWPGGDPIGQTIETTSGDGSKTTRRIVGIVGDTRSFGMDTKRRAELFVPYAQEPSATLIYFLVRSRASAAQLAPAIRSAVDTVSPGQIVDAIDSLQESVDRSVSRPRFGAWFLGIFAAIAVGLAAMGLGAVIAWWVAQRRREIGVRMALGATKSQMVGLVVRQGMTLTVFGVLIGAGAAFIVTRWLAEWLYGVTPTDPLTFIVGGAGMFALAAIAAYLPARRAASIDPAVTLRSE